MNEDYVSYELAKKLKECGFNEPCDHYYTPNKAMRIVKDNALAPETANNRFLDEIADGCCAAVPLWQAQKWLREKKDVLLWVYPDRQLTDEEYPKIELTGEWWWDTEGVIRECSGDTYPSYEAALSAGIAAALELIKKGE